jgi:hypothetical protein
VTDAERLDAVATHAPVSTPPGWFTDPGDPKRDRWWTGSEWATITARAPRSMYGPAFARSMRAGLNKNARLGMIFSRVALLLWLLSTFFVRFGDSTTPFAASASLGLLPIVVVLAVAGIVFSVRGLAAAKQLGGRLLCLYSIYGGIVAIALPAIGLFFAFAVR